MGFNSGTMGRSKATKPAAVAAAPVQVDPDLAEVLDQLSVAEVIELVQEGEASLADVIAAEKAGKARKTILSLVQSDSGRIYPVSHSG